MDPVLFFVTPVYRRFALTKVCLEQRARMLERLPFEAHQVVVGDDENLDVARELGFDVVELGNEYVARKFNAGYRHAVSCGATHCMPIGSDSWLHESVFADEEFEPRKALCIVGLSSFSPDGQERIDMAIRYPAGFGVGMVYPAWALNARHLNGEAADPLKQRGIDNSTWARVGKGRVQVRFMEPKSHLYINFHSTEESITDFRLLRSSTGRVRVRDERDPFGPLAKLYDDDLLEDLKRMYALRALDVFCTGVKPVFSNPRQSARRRHPNVGLRPRSRGIAKGEPRDYEQIQARKELKRRGHVLSREEEMSIRFDEARGF